MLVAARNNHLIHVGVHDQVCVVGDNNNLPALFCFAERRNQLLKNGLRIQVFLRLVDDQRPFIVSIQAR